MEKHQVSISKEEAFHRLTDIVRCKWTLAILDALADGVNRPSLIEKKLDGLSAKVMNERFKKLERFGLIKKNTYSEFPPHVEYDLTDTGKELVKVLNEMRMFAHNWSKKAL